MQQNRVYLTVFCYYTPVLNSKTASIRNISKSVITLILHLIFYSSVDSILFFSRFSLQLDNDVIYLHHMLEIYHIRGHYYEQRKTYSVSNSKIHAPLYHQWLFVAPLLIF